jgi:hypothetical protein
MKSSVFKFALLLLVALSGPVQASISRLSFDAYLTTDALALPAGQKLTGYFDIDLDTPNSYPGFSFGLYEGAVKDLQFKFANKVAVIRSYPSPKGSSHYQDVRPLDWPSDDFLSITSDLDGDNIGPSASYVAGMAIFNLQGANILNGVELGDSIKRASSFTSGTLSLSYYDDHAGGTRFLPFAVDIASIKVTSAIPEPVPTVFLSVGLCLLALLKKRRPNMKLVN